MKEICFSRKSDDHKTPKILFDSFIESGFIDCFKFKSLNDELINEYYNEKLFINPPYSIINKKIFKDWITKQYIQQNDIFLLIPSRTDTKLFKMLYEISRDIIFIQGRLKFNDGKYPAPFPSVIYHLKFSINENNPNIHIKNLEEVIEYVEIYNYTQKENK